MEERILTLPAGLHLTDIPFGVPAGTIRGSPIDRYIITAVLEGVDYCVSDNDPTGRDDVRSWMSLDSARSTAAEYIRRGAAVDAIIRLSEQGRIIGTYCVDDGLPGRPVTPEFETMHEYHDAGSW